MWIATAWNMCNIKYMPYELQSVNLYRVIQNDCWGFNNLSYTVH